MSSGTPFGPSGSVVYSRTYSRTRNDGTKETWPETVRRVVFGNLSLVYKDSDSWTQEVWEEAADLCDYMDNFALLPAGRHLWSSGVTTHLFNCWVAPWGDKLSDHFQFSFLRLMEGGGVGSNYSTKYVAKFGQPKRKIDLHIISDQNHPDYAEMSDYLSAEYRPIEGWDYSGPVPVLTPENCTYPGDGVATGDSREGWAADLVDLIDMFMSPMEYTTDIARVYDVGGVRPSGSELKTFGGTASGPAPFARMMHEVARILNDAYANGLTPLHAMEIDHAIAECVVSGGNRRSARMALLNWNDPHIMKFLKCKQDTGKHWTTNVSVEIDDEFFESLNGNRGMGAQVQANWVHEAVCKGMLENGEPGYWNSSLSQKGEVGEVIATNPCLTGETLIMTVNGPVPIKEMCAAPSWAVIDGKAYRATAAWSTGVKDIFRLQTKEGYEVRLTADHRVLRSDGVKVPACDLVPGDRISLANDRGIPEWKGSGSWEEGYLCGALKGDGYLSGNSAFLKVWDADEGSEGIANEAYRAALTVSHRSDWTGFNGDGRGTRIMSVHSSRLEQFGIIKSGKPVTQKIERTSAAFTRGFLRAWFDADGHLELNKAKGTSVRLSSIDYEGLQAVQRMLLRLGVKSRIYNGKEAGWKKLPDGRGGTREYAVKQSWRLVISADDIPVYAEKVGFSHTVKAEKLAKILTTQRFYSKPFVAVVMDLVPDGHEEVFDMTVDTAHLIEANGLNVSNCGEISLESNEPCNLGHVNMDYFWDRPMAELEEAHRLMTRFLMRATFGDVNDPKSREILNRNRRIGVGHLGVQGYWAKRDVEYSRIPKEAPSELNRLYQTVRDEARRYAFALRIPEPVKVTTVAPTGSVAKLPGVSEGIHPIYARWFERRIRFSKRDASQMNTVLEAMEQGFRVEDDVYDQSGMTAVVVYPTEDILVQQVRDLGHDESVVQSAEELTIDQMLEVQKCYQENWADNAVSYTVNIPENIISVPVLADILTDYLPHLKGTTIMVDSSRPQAPYTRITKEAYERALAKTAEDSTNLECRSGSCPIK